MRIMILDDSNIYRYTIMRNLKDAGYNDLVTLGAADEALPLIGKEHFDIIFLDWNLPHMSGLDVLRVIRSSRQTADMNVVMVTTIHERKNILQALRIGIQGYLLKPVDPALLVKKIKEVELQQSA